VYFLLLSLITLTPTHMVEAFTFEEMVNTAELVVIAKVDSIWYTVDTSFVDNNNKPYQVINAWTHISAELMNTYVKDTTKAPLKNTIHIVHRGGKVGPDEWIRIIPSVSFTEDEVFLAAVCPDEAHSENVYRVQSRLWKYTLSDDSIIGTFETQTLGEAVLALSASFTEIR